MVDARPPQIAGWKCHRAYGAEFRANSCLRLLPVVFFSFSLRVAAGFGRNFAHVLPERDAAEPARVSRDYGRTLNGTPPRNYVRRSIVLETPWRKTRTAQMERLAEGRIRRETVL